LMRNHGVVCLGRTLADGCAAVLALERAASDWFAHRERRVA
jgi:ribulose-5-phosphate 4-epimerase/fuculose-1-phosphate aldolase